jgi:hypothetical protein
MSKPRFLAFPCGRLATATLGLALINAGALAMAPAGPLAVLLSALTTLAIACGYIISTGLATIHFGAHAFIMLIALPFLGGPYFFALTVLPGRGAAIGLPLVALGVVTLGIGILGATPSTAEAGEHSQPG